MRVLVTGGAGFIGSHLTDALLDRGDEVTVVDDLTTGRVSRLDDRVSLHKVSITDAPALAAVVGEVRPEVICHLAAQIDVRASVAHPGVDAMTNVVGTINVLEAAQSVEARVVFASTGGALYGEEAPIPSPEHLVPAPEAPYGTAKYCAEQYIDLFNRLHGGRHSVLRLANVFGPRQSAGGEAGVVSIFCGRAHAGEPVVIFGNGGQTRDYVYVGDVVEAFVAAARAGLPGTWNIGTGVETSVLGLVELVGRASGEAIDPAFEPARKGELQRSALDVTRAANDLGWRAGTSVAAGVERVYGWVRDGQPDRGSR
jgi:UDP-glucose 4-epimerase